MFLWAGEYRNFFFFFYEFLLTWYYICFLISFLIKLFFIHLTATLKIIIHTFADLVTIPIPYHCLTYTSLYSEEPSTLFHTLKHSWHYSVFSVSVTKTTFQLSMFLAQTPTHTLRTATEIPVASLMMPQWGGSCWTSASRASPRDSSSTSRQSLWANPGGWKWLPQTPEAENLMVPLLQKGWNSTFVARMKWHFYYKIKYS